MRKGFICLFLLVFSMSVFANEVPKPTLSNILVDNLQGVMSFVKESANGMGQIIHHGRDSEVHSLRSDYA